MNSGGGSRTRASSSGGGRECGGWRGGGGGEGGYQELRFDGARSSRGGASWRRQRTAWTSRDTSGACGARRSGSATDGSLARTHRYAETLHESSIKYEGFLLIKLEIMFDVSFPVEFRILARGHGKQRRRRGYLHRCPQRSRGCHCGCWRRKARCGL